MRFAVKEGNRVKVVELNEAPSQAYIRIEKGLSFTCESASRVGGNDGNGNYQHHPLPTADAQAFAQV